MSAQRFALVSPSFSVQEIGRDQFCAKSYIFDMDLWEMQCFFMLRFAGGAFVCGKKKAGNAIFFAKSLEISQKSSNFAALATER